MIVHESAKSGRQARAALGPTATQHPASCLRPHAQAEAVLLASLAIVRLKCPLHAWPPRTPEPQPDEAPGARRATATLKSAMSLRHTGATGAGTAREQRQSVRRSTSDRQSRPCGPHARSLVAFPTALIWSATPVPGIGHLALPRKSTRRIAVETNAQAGAFCTSVDTLVDNLGEPPLWGHLLPMTCGQRWLPRSAPSSRKRRGTRGSKASTRSS